MPETFFILLAGGVMLAAAISDPRAVDLRWLRLAGILALCFAGLGFYFVHNSSAARESQSRAVYIGLAIAIFGQLAFVQIAFRVIQRVSAGVATFLAVMLASSLMRQDAPSTVFPPHGVPWSYGDWLTIAAAVGIAATSGIALMDMLLGHAYLTAAKMTIAPFRRLNFALALAMVFSAILSVIAIIVQRRWAIELFWTRYGLYVGTRWLVGLLVPGVFVYMAHDCIKRRSTQSATGILYVAGVLLWIGEILALYLARETRLPL